MQFAKFSRTGLTVSRLCLGTATFGKQTEEAASREILDKAADAGVNFIDTSDVYPINGDLSLVGRSEEITGRWLKGKRARFIVATKAGGPMGPSNWDQGSSRKHLLDAIDASLKRLGTDYVDLYQLHLDDSETPLDESAEALDLIVRSGKARYVGVSNFVAYRLARMIGRQDVLKLVRCVSVQPRYNLLFREIERELLPLAREDNLAVIPFNPLAGGLLTGRYRHDASPDTGRFSSELGQMGAMYKARYWHQREFETVEKLHAIASERGESLPTLSVAWMLANEAITSVILGASRPDQLTDTLAAADHTLDSDLKAKLDNLTIDYRSGVGERPVLIPSFSR
jgi:aryl-alcohol dehydrogenase-like predicted oxidoreductase